MTVACLPPIRSLYTARRRERAGRTGSGSRKKDGSWKSIGMEGSAGTNGGSCLGSKSEMAMDLERQKPSGGEDAVQSPEAVYKRAEFGVHREKETV